MCRCLSFKGSRTTRCCASETTPHSSMLPTEKSVRGEDALWRSMDEFDDSLSCLVSPLSLEMVISRSDKHDFHPEPPSSWCKCHTRRSNTLDIACATLFRRATPHHHRQREGRDGVSWVLTGSSFVPTAPNMNHPIWSNYIYHYRHIVCLRDVFGPNLRLGWGPI